MELICLDPTDAPEIPKWFTSRLRDTDAGLVIYWNRFKRRFVVDRCTNPDPHTHHALCPHSNVMIVESEEGHYMPPCDAVIDKIRGMDAWNRFGNLANFRRDHENAKAEYDVKAKQQASAGYREAMLDDKRQILQAIDLIKRHDVERVNQ